MNINRSDQIRQNIESIKSEIPGNVDVAAAAKTRSPEEILTAIHCGITVIGENYVQEAELAFKAINDNVKWHFIGSLQKNKINKAIRIFDVIETVDSEDLAREINKKCEAINKTISVLVEVNSGREPQKSGVVPEDTIALLKLIAGLSNVKIEGLMTMGPYSGDPEDARPYFKETKKIFDEIKSLNIPDVEMKTLSMGMSNSYKVAIEEGANLVRIGTGIFGER